jgi:enterochelin esterase-like enzyme
MADDVRFPAGVGPDTYRLRAAPILQSFRERARSAWESLLQPADVNISPARRDQNGFWTHKVRSPYQAGSTRIRVLLPEATKSCEPYPVVYVLPVEARDGTQYGDGLREVQKHDLHNRYGAIFVAPTFSHPPWYADHPTHSIIRQETYLLDVVLPFVERTYPIIARREGRRLLGFSKSGWGAWTLLLRHPDVFDQAASWDAPVMMEWPSQFDSAEIFATRENFECYHLQRLLRERRPMLGSQCRLWLAGYRIFRSHNQEIHALLERLQIRHEYHDGPDRAHDWHSGWVSESVAWLLGPQVT